MTYLLLYFLLYKLALFPAILFMMVVLSHTDRVHMRERARRFGAQLVEALANYVGNNYFPDNTSDSKAYLTLFYLRLYLWRPVCILTDMVGGFNEGIEHLEPTVMIVEPYSAYRLNQHINPMADSFDNSQTQHVETVERENQSDTNRAFGRIDPNSHKRIAKEIMNDDDNNSDNSEVVVISTQSDDDNPDLSDLSDVSNDSDNEETKPQAIFDRRRTLRDDNDSDSENGSESGSENGSRSRSSSRSPSPKPRRRGIRVKRVAPRSNIKRKIRLARRR